MPLGAGSRAVLEAGRVSSIKGIFVRAMSLATVVLGVSATGCTYDDTFSACPFSTRMKEECAGEDGAAFSCVVREHPQCSQDVCLSWKGGEARCTLTCTPDGGQCPGGSTCTAYVAGHSSTAGAEHFCVQDEFLDEQFVTGSGS